MYYREAAQIPIGTINYLKFVTTRPDLQHSLLPITQGHADVVTI